MPKNVGERPQIERSNSVSGNDLALGKSPKALHFASASFYRSIEFYGHHAFAGFVANLDEFAAFNFLTN